jgi:hypothetical protein
MISIAVRDLAERLRHFGHHVSDAQLVGFLQRWRQQGVCELDSDGWRLTSEGARRFAILREVEPSA